MYKVHFIKGVRHLLPQWLIERSDKAWNKIKKYFQGKRNIEDVWVEETCGTVPSGDSF